MDAALLAILDATPDAELLTPDAGWDWVLRPRRDIHHHRLDAGRIAGYLAGLGYTRGGAPLTAADVGVSSLGRIVVRADQPAPAGNGWDGFDPDAETDGDRADRDADVELDAALAAVALLPMTPERRLLQALAAATKRRSG